MSVPEMFGKLVFDDRTMRSVLPGKVYDAMRRTIDKGEKLDLWQAGFPDVRNMFLKILR